MFLIFLSVLHLCKKKYVYFFGACYILNWLNFGGEFWIFLHRKCHRCTLD